MQAQAEIACPHCHRLLPVEPGGADLSVACPNCKSPLHAYFFPAFSRGPEAGTAAAALVNPEEASCFYHPQKQAACVCDGCGRLICSLCAINLGSGCMCPACLSAGRRKQSLQLTTERVRYDNVALGLAVASIFMSFFAFITAPAAIYLAIRHWNGSGGINGPSRVRSVVAVVLALLAFAFWSFLVFTIFTAGMQAGHHHHRVP